MEARADEVGAGWLHDRQVVNELAVKTALVASEAMEAVEELLAGHTADTVYYGAEGKPEGYPVELADVVIRAFDLAWSLGIDLSAIIQEKLAFNETRGERHGGKVL